MKSMNQESLIKDFDTTTQRIVFYWQDECGKFTSPFLPTLQDAEHWWVKKIFDSYDGAERRSSTIDRRRLASVRTDMIRAKIQNTPYPDGRRKTDRLIKVERDISKYRLLQFYAANPELASVSEN